MSNPIKFLLIANMYPGPKQLHFGVFIRSIEEGLSANNVHVDRIVISGRGRNLFEKIKKYIHFYWQILTASLNQYDVIQLCYPSHGFFPFFFRVPRNPLFVVRLHGLDLLGGDQEGWWHTLLSWLFTRPAIKRADLVVVPSQYFLQEVEKRFKIRDFFVYPSGGVDMSLFRPMDIQSVRPTVGYVGRIDTLKGVDVLLKAIAMMKTSPDLVVIGDGHLLDESRKLALQLGIGDQVTFRGGLPHNALAVEYNRMDVLAFPTMRKAESFGNVAIEAMACGVPVVGSRMAGLSEYMLDGINGLSVDPGSPDGLARALDAFFSLDEVVRQQMRVAALATAGNFERNCVSRGYVEKLKAKLSST